MTVLGLTISPQFGSLDTTSKGTKPLFLLINMLSIAHQNTIRSQGRHTRINESPRPISFTDYIATLFAVRYEN